MKTALASKTPLSVFLYNRPEHSERLFQSLSACRRLDECALHVYCDAPRDPAAAAQVAATRRVAQAWCERLGGSLVEREKNLGLAASIAGEVGNHCRRSGKVIVLEDDLMVHPEFINYMLNGLDRYQDADRVYQISGFAFDAPQPPKPQVFFLPFTCSWGWGTWRRAWQAFDIDVDLSGLPVHERKWRRRFDLNGCFHFSDLVAKGQQGRGDMWAIYWYIAVFQRAGLALYPRVSLVANNGFDGSGVHCGARPRYGIATKLNPEWPPFPSAIDWPSQAEVDQAAFRRVQAFLHKQEKLWKQRPSLGARVRGMASWLAPGWLKAALRAVRSKGRA